MNCPLLYKTACIGFLSLVLLAMPNKNGADTMDNSAKGLKLKDSRSFRDYTIRIYKIDEEGDDNGKGFFEIMHKGMLVYRQKGTEFKVGYLYEDLPGNDLIEMGRNITGNGVPDLVISEYTGGAHCCLSFDIFELGPELRHLDRIEAEHGDMSHFEKLGGDNDLACIINDWTFAYWKTGFASSPAPRIILRYCNGRYLIADDLMRGPSPTRKELAKKARDILALAPWTSDNPPPDLWGYMLDLIYSGNEQSAWDFFDQAWPASIPGKEEFLKDFRKHLSTSRYWPQVKLLNERKPVCGAGRQ